MTDYTEAQANMLKEKDICSPLVLMLIYEQLKNTGSDGLILSIARAMEHRIEERDQLIGVNMESFRRLIKESINIEVKNKISSLEKRIDENRGPPSAVRLSVQPSTSGVTKGTASGIPKPAAKRTYIRRKALGGKKKDEACEERLPTKKSRPVKRKAPTSKSSVSSEDDTDVENIFEPPMQSKQTALNVTKATSKDQQRTLTDPRDAADGVETTEKDQPRQKKNSKLSLARGKDQQITNAEPVNAAPPAIQYQNENAVNSIVSLVEKEVPSPYTEQTNRAVESILPASPIAGPSGVQGQKEPGQQKWNPSEEPDNQRRQFLTEMEMQSKKITKLPPAKKNLFFGDPKIRPVPESSVPIHQILDAGQGTLPSPERLPMSDAEESPVHDGLSPLIRHAEDLHAQLAKKIEIERLVIEKLAETVREREAIEAASAAADQRAIDEELAQSIQIGGGKKLFDIVSVVEKEVPKFKVTAREYTLKLNKPSHLTNFVEYYNKVIVQMVELFKSEAAPLSKIGIVIRNSQQPEMPLALSYRFVNMLSADTLWQLIFRVAQSNANFLLAGTLNATVQVVDVPRGLGKLQRGTMSIDEYIKRKRGILEIKNRGTKCLAHAIVMGLCLISKTPNVELYQNDEVRMEQEVEELCELADCDLENGGSIEELKLFQSILPPGIQLVVYDDLKGKSVFFKERMPDVEHRINLLLLDNHFSTIKSVTSAFTVSYFCQECSVGYEEAGKHLCRNACSYCHAKPPCKFEGVEIVCKNCNRKYFSRTCFENHKVNKVTKFQSVCQSYKKCDKCFKTYKLYKNRKPHVCDEVYCKLCGNYVPSNHNCFMQPDKNKQPKSDDQTLLVYFDIECTQDTRVSDENVDGFFHVPNFLVSFTVCSACRQDLSLVICHKCGVRKKVFKLDPIKIFVDFLRLPRKDFKKIIIIAHYGGKYDNIFVLNYLLTDCGLAPKVIMKGTQIISIEVGNLKFLDSFSFISLPLSKFQSTFNLPPLLKKGFFPHFFNVSENQSYVGPIPDMIHFAPDDMSSAMRGEFFTWYAEQQDIEYNFAKELEEYCTSDSMLLMQACEKFRATMLKIGNVNCFSESVTLAGMCNLVFRRNFLPKDTISIIPNHGYRWKDQQSIIAIKFLLAEELRLGIEIQHSGRAGEFVTPTGHLVDGCAILDGKPTVWEYQGCYFHYCQDCYSRNNVPLKDDPHSTMNFRRERTVNKIKTLKQFGYNVVEMYDCKFRALLAANPHLLSYVNNHPLTQNEPLVPRDALFGGRTDGMRKYYKCAENEKIHFADIISVYPKILRDFKVPVGVPKLHLGPEFPSLLETEGLVKCLILPPRKLFHPVLPIKMHSKLMFVLCRKCAEQYIYENCPHNDPRDRSIRGTWVIDEVRLAIKHGYNVLEIYEIWEYEVRVANKANSDGVFFDYVNTFLKIKQQASGWPEWCVDEETKERYIQKYKETEGIELDRNDIEYNAGLRYIAKLCLNTTWGYLCKNSYKSQTKIVNEPKQLFAALENPNFDVTNLRVFGEKAVLLNYDILSDVVPPDPKVNVTVACYVTCGARIMLYELLAKLQQRAFYVDTDSVCYLQRPGEDVLPLGEELGALSNELKSYGGEGTHIDEICVAGAKNYAMKIVDADKNLLTTVCKVKGITLNFRASQQVNFDVMKDMILYEGDGEPTVDVDIPHKIFRNKYLDVITKPTSKKYRPVHDKRKTYDESYICYPFGFILN